MRKLRLSGTALVVLALASGCATGTSRLCGRDARYFVSDDSMKTTPAYTHALAVTFPELKAGVCDPDNDDGTARFVVYHRINSPERHCFAQREAAR